MSKITSAHKHSDQTDWNRNAVLVQPGTFAFSAGKQQITLRVDKDVVEFFRRQGKGYQRLMNFALRAYMLRQGAAPDSSKSRSSKRLKRRSA